MLFHNKVCVVTGGAKGIGLCILREFAKKGARLAFIDMDMEAGEAALKDVKDIGAEALFYPGDIGDNTVLQGFTEKVILHYGRIDYLINNACLSRKGILSGCDYEDFNYVLRVGVTAPYILSKLFLEHFNEGASIVNISSSRALMSQEDTESYTAAKGGISALTHALAVSLSGRVRVNSISPGWIDVSTDLHNHSKADKLQHPVHRVGKPLDIARAVMFLCDEENSFITGENIVIDGGMTKKMIYNDDYGWSYNPQ